MRTSYCIPAILMDGVYRDGKIIASTTSRHISERSARAGRLTVLLTLVSMLFLMYSSTLSRLPARAARRKLALPSLYHRTRRQTERRLQLLASYHRHRRRRRLASHVTVTSVAIRQSRHFAARYNVYIKNDAVTTVCNATTTGIG